MHPNETVVVLLDAILLEAQSPAVVGGGESVLQTGTAKQKILCIRKKIGIVRGTTPT